MTKCHSYPKEEIPMKKFIVAHFKGDSLTNNNIEAESFAAICWMIGQDRLKDLLGNKIPSENIIAVRLIPRVIT